MPLLDRLRARLGEDAVTLVAPHAEHRPERASENSVGFGLLRDFSRASSAAGSGARRIAPDPVLPDLPPRPVWLLAEPQPLGPLQVRNPWVLREGPERIESGWWDGDDVRRDYFVATTPRGELAWIYRDGRHGFGEGDGGWFLQGFFA